MTSAGVSNQAYRLGVAFGVALGGDQTYGVSADLSGKGIGGCWTLQYERQEEEEDDE